MPGIVAALQRGRAGIERHRHREYFEDGTHLVDAERRTIEPSIDRSAARLVRIEIRQRDHRQNLAAMDVQDDARAAERREIGDCAAQLFAQDVLQTDIDRKRQRAVLFGEMLLEFPLDSRKAVIVDIGKAEDVRHQLAMRVDAPLFTLEGEAGNAEPVDGILLLGSEIALKPDEAAAG